jgi:hypothetical protein
MVGPSPWAVGPVVLVVALLAVAVPVRGDDPANPFEPPSPDRRASAFRVPGFGRAPARSAADSSRVRRRRPRLLRWLRGRRVKDAAVAPAAALPPLEAAPPDPDEGKTTPPAVVQPGAPGAPELTGIEGLLSERISAEQPGAPPSSVIPKAPTPLLLNRALNLQDAPVRVFGWIENSFTGNTNGTPRNGENFAVYPNHLANRWMGNQYYFVLENPLEQNDTVNLGFRFDTLFGNDWLFTKDYGLFDRAFPNNHFAGVDFPQIYGEVHLPILTKNGLDIRGGRFYSLTGFESPQAVARPLLSVPYLLNFTPFTFVGMVSTLHLTDRVNLVNGSINGFDRWIDTSYHWGYLGALTWLSRDRRTTMVLGGASVPDQLPRFAPADSPFVPVGTPTPPFLSGRINPLYTKSWRGYVALTVTHKWTDKLTEAVDFHNVWEPDILGITPSPSRAHSAAYHGLAHWFLYQVHPQVLAVWRSEIFWDPYGLATGVADTFYEITLGLNIRPKPWLWIRPEARYDWSQFTHPFNDGTRNSQLTLGIDAIILF